MRSRSVVFGLFFLLVVASASGQYRERAQRPAGSGGSGGLSDKIYFGGGGGFSGGTDFISLSLSPLIGYKITDAFSAGLQITYQYVKFRQVDISINNYGGGPFLRYNLTPNFFTYTQYEYLNFGEIGGGGFAEPRRFHFHSWFVGIGYSEPIGANAAFNITALYNVMYRDGQNSPYGSPLQFRVGIVAGLF